MDKIHYFAFAGGGCRGLAYLGTLLAIEEYFQNGVLLRSNIKGCIGTSIGAIFALACVVRVPPRRMFELLWRDHLLARLEPEVDPATVHDSFGLNDGSALKWMAETLLQEATPPVLPVTATFANLHEQGFPDLVVTVTDLSLNKVCHLSYQTDPDMPVALAVAASMSVPVLFRPMKWKDRLLVDGALLENVSASYFPLRHTLVFRLGRDTAEPCTATALCAVGFTGYLRRLLGCSLAHQEQLHLDSTIRAAAEGGSASIALHIIDVYTGGSAETFSFRLTRKQQLDTIIAGLLLTHDAIFYIRGSMKIATK